ncbi:hypothetical protein C5167_035069 [Papaver somniferum]|uniref:Uncharacterized protein n=2 Tax=Papaver somniferum TaxID=3469 RepID=A0A4Y7KEW0_PAPSO|nr:hypothetical protein C5167_035069 [Papaver somniferum]
MKNNLHCLSMKLGDLCSCSCIKVTCLGKSLGYGMACFYRYLIFKLKPFWLQLCYFMCISFMGFLVLKVLKPRSSNSINPGPIMAPANLDMFFTSVSATTVSSMSTIEMEVFSNAQLVILTIIMLFGGEVFTFFVELQIEKSKLIIKRKEIVENVSIVVHKEDHCPRINELGEFAYNGSSENGVRSFPVANMNEPMAVTISTPHHDRSSNEDLKYKSVKYLSYVVLGYLVVILGGGSILVIMYMRLVPSANEVLKVKGINTETFSIFLIIATFANCGYVPTNEGMVIFRKNSGLLLLLIPQVLLGNTLFPAGLRFVLWVLGKFSKREEIHHMLKLDKKISIKEQVGYPANEVMISTIHCFYLIATVLGFIFIQFILFCSMEWNSDGLDGMNSYQKLIGALFQTVNTRHSGENIVDLSTTSPAIMVAFVVMMYLPPYTSFLPLINDERSIIGCCDQRKKRRRRTLVDNLLFSQLSYLVMFIVLICIIERNKLKDDPLNFNVFNITIEVISAYGNVGFTTGYSCKRQLNPDGLCKDMMFGFVGRWSNVGKIILIVVMIFGRVKRFNLRGGKAWKLSTQDL